MRAVHSSAFCYPSRYPRRFWSNKLNIFNGIILIDYHVLFVICRYQWYETAGHNGQRLPPFMGGSGGAGARFTRSLNNAPGSNGASSGSSGPTHGHFPEGVEGRWGDRDEEAGIMWSALR